MPTVSVVLPNYNYARYLPRRIASILDQTFCDLELIFLDDASTDDSVAVFSRSAAADSRVREPVINTTNSGSPFIQWNRGIRYATGKYIWIAEADDWADAQLLERLVAQLDAHPRAAMAYCQSWIVQDDRVVEPLLPGDHFSRDFIRSGLDECREHNFVHCVVANASAVLFRRELFDAVGGADESYRLVADWKFWSELMLRGDVAFVAEPLNYFRWHAATVRTNSARDGREIVERWRLFGEMLPRVRPAPDVRDAACERLLARWTRLFHTMPLSANRRALGLALRHDPRFVLRVLRHQRHRWSRWARYKIDRARGMLRKGQPVDRPDADVPFRPG